MSQKSKSTAPSSSSHSVTVSDWLKYATRLFTQKKLVFGHGTATARDEAAFLILHSLDLLPQDLDSHLRRELQPDECARLQHLLDKRVETRKPASYLTNAAWIGNTKFYVDENVIVPRSFIGELLSREDEDLWFLDKSPDQVRSVLDLCTGSGCLAILAAKRFPNASLIASDLSDAALKIAERNISEHQLAKRITLCKADLFDGMPSAGFDLIIANPPYVCTEEIDAFPAEYSAEPVMAHAGGAEGMDLVRRILEASHGYLNPRGALLMEVGTGKDILEAQFPLPFVWIDTDESVGEVLCIPAEELQNFAHRQVATLRP
jgi:ribosomal protein L3 glutamine methyltransferase